VHGRHGEPQVKKYDIETWMPGRNGYGETMSNSFMGDFQARRLKIRYKNKEGRTLFGAYTNNTAIASRGYLLPYLKTTSKRRINSHSESAPIVSREKGDRAMSYLSYLFPRTVARYSTKYNHDIRILEENGNINCFQTDQGSQGSI